MSTLFQIIRRHLWAWLAVAALSPAWASTGAQMSAPDALAASRASQVTLIDVRTPAEWQQTGVPQGAARIDMSQAGFLEAVLKQTKGDKSAPLALICRTGNRSTQVQSYLEAQGFTHVFNVKEGMSGSAAGPGWLRRSLPLQ